MFLKKEKRNRGFSVLGTVLLVNATVLLVVSGLFLRSIDEANKTADLQNSLIAWNTVNTCGEYALMQLASTTDGNGWSYGGDESLSVGDNICYIYEVEDGDDGSRLVNASSTVSGFTKKISIDIATNTPSLVVDSWEEVASFD